MKKTQRSGLFSIIGGLLVLALVLSCASSGGKTENSGPSEGVLGNWTFEINNDANDGGASTIQMTEAEEVIDGNTVKTYLFKGEISNKIQYGIVDASIIPDEETLARLKTARAISFKFQADGKPYNVEAPLSTVKDWGFHRYSIKTESGEVQDVFIDMRMFIQPAWANPIMFNKQRLTMIRIQPYNATEGGPGPYEFKIWDIKTHQ